MKAHNIKQIRETLGFNQEEFAYLVGISSVYLSQIETGNRPLNLDTAEKIAKGLSWLSHQIYEDNEIGADVTSYPYMVKAETIRANHIASFYPEKVQEEVLKLEEQKQRIEFQLDYILDKGQPFPLEFTESEPEPPFKFLTQSLKSDTSHETFLRETIKERVDQVKEKFSNKKKKKIAYQKGGYFFDESEENFTW